MDKEKEIEDAIARLKELSGGEMDHIVADNILCELIEKLTGDDRVTEAYHNIDKWYS